MVLPPALRTDAQVMPVSGRDACVVCDSTIRFGPFHTDEVHRGIREDDSTSWSLISESDRWEAKRSFSFVLEGPSREPWRVRCAAAAGRVHVEAPVGVGTRANGDFGILRQVVESSARETLQCDFRGAGGGRRQLLLSDADESGFGGLLTNEAHEPLARIRATDEQTGEPYHYTVTSPLGFLVETTAGLQVAVERAFQGKVIFDRATPAAEQTPLAALATALLLWDRLR
jgi:hypothetical protein